MRAIGRSRVRFALVLSVAAFGATPAAGAGVVQEAAEGQDTAAASETAAEAIADTAAEAATSDTTAAEAPATPQVPTARVELDRRIEEQLNAVLGRIPELDEARARVEAGVVVLEGRVLSQEDRALADSLAARMPDVFYVENRIDTVTSLRSRLGAALAGARERLLDFVAYLPLLVVAALIVAAFALLAGWVGARDRLYERATPNLFAQNILRQAARGGLILIGLLLALQLLEVTALVGAILGAAGIFGLAVGFAFRAIAENYLAGVFLGFRQPFDPNDHVAMEGQEGKVVRLNARETVLMTLEGNHLRIPNAKVFGSAILNYTRNPRRRFGVTVSVGDAEDLQRALTEGTTALDEMEGVLEDPEPSGQVAELGDGVVTLRFFGWVDQRAHDFGKVRSEAIRIVKTRLDAAGITMPPTAYLVQMASAAAPTAVEADEATAVAREARPPDRAVAEGPPGRKKVGDISVDRAIDRQIEEDRRASQEEDLLDAAEPRSGT